MTGPVESEVIEKTHPGGGAIRRLGPAFALIAVGLATAVAGEWSFAAIVAVASVLMLLEWQTMTAISRTSPTAVLQSAAAIAAIGLAAADAPQAGLAVIGIGTIAAGAAAHMAKANIAHAAAGILCIGLPAIAAVWLRAVPEVGLANILWLYAVVWAGDSGAYAFGRSIEGPRRAPDISPNKTWAGAIGGAVASIAAGIGAAALLGGFSSILVVVVVSIVITVTSQLGDLAESIFKRSVNVKDSGNLLPGHGGALDRLDGFLAAVLIAFVIAYLFAGDGPVWIR